MPADYNRDRGRYSQRVVVNVFWNIIFDNYEYEEIKDLRQIIIDHYNDNYDDGA